MTYRVVVVTTCVIYCLLTAWAWAECPPTCATTTGQSDNTENDQNGGMGDMGGTQEDSSSGGGTLSFSGSLGDQIFSGIFGASGSIPVYDKADVAKNTITSIKTTALLVDALRQALLGSGPNNGTTGPLIAKQSEYGQSGSVLYGQYSPDLWNDTYKEDVVYERGEWAAEETERNHRRLTTQQDVMQLYKMRQDAFATDAARIQSLKDAVESCKGRNCAIQSQAAVQAEAAWQSLQTQQVLMSLGTSLANAEGGKVNEETQRRAMEKYFLTNGGTEPEKPTFVDRGL